MMDRLSKSEMDVSDRMLGGTPDAVNLANFCVAQAADSVFWIDRQGRIVYANQKACEVLEYSAEELQAMTVFDIDTVVTRDLWKAHWTDLQEHKAFVREGCQQTRSGRLIPVEISVNYLAVDGKEYNCAFVRDISDRKRSEKQLAHLSAIVNSSRDAIVGADLAGIVTSWNTGAESLYGYPAAEMIGQSLSKLLPVPSEKEIESLSGPFAQSSEVTHLDTVRRRKDGSLVDVSLTFSPIADNDGRVIGISVIAHDITERKRDQDSLRASEDRLRNIIQNASQIIYTLSVEGVFTFVHPETTRRLGYDASELEGRSFIPLVHPDDVPVCQAFLLQVLSSKEPPEPATYRVRHKNGSWCWYRSSGSCVRDLEGRPAYFVGVAEDVTERKRAEEVLRQSEERYRTLIDNIDLGIGLIDADRNILAANRTLAHIVGQSSLEAMIGQKCFRVNEGRSAVCSHCPGTRALATKQPAEEDITLTRSDGTCVQIRIKAFPVLDAEGNSNGFIEVVEDITERKRAEKERAHFSAIVNSSLDAIIGLTLDGTITSWNPGAERLYGYGAAEMVGQSVSLILPPDRPNEAERLLARLAHDGRVKHYDTVRCRKDGALVDVFVTLSPIQDENGKLIGASGICHEITDRKQTERELIDAKQAAETASRAKSAFLANMSHEIRTPMTAILGFADILLGQPNAEEAVESAQIIKRNGEQLLNIINDILDLSKIEAGKFAVDSQPCSPRKIVDEVLATMHVRADAKGLRLGAHLDAGVPEAIRTDPIRLRQILVNLVGNAVKFTEMGDVQVVVCLIPSHANEALIRFDVIDTGIGMSSHQVDLLFQPFSQADASTTRRFGGTGLGLAISKRLATMLGGDILVSSIPGRGSTFTLTIAADPQGDPSPSPHGEDSRKLLSSVHTDLKALDCRVLLAEDGPDNQRLIAFLLRKAGCEITVAENGQKAVELILAAQPTSRPYDIVLMDIQMPVMDGYEATRQLRNSGFTNPIIALTAHAMVEDRQRCLDAGCNDYASKPIRARQLIQTLTSWIDQARQATPSVDKAE